MSDNRIYKHTFGPRRQHFRASLVVSASHDDTSTAGLRAQAAAPSQNSTLLALTLQDFGSAAPEGMSSMLLARPCSSQLRAALQHLQDSCSSSWAEEISLYFEGGGVEWRDGWNLLQLLKVTADDSAAAGAGGCASGSGNDGSQLLDVLVDLELHCQGTQCPMLIHLDACSSSGEPTQEQKHKYHKQKHELRNFSHRVTAMGFEGGEQLSFWFWYFYKHTFLVWHPSWQAAHAAAVSDLKAAGVWAPSPVFARDESNTTLFPHGYVPAQHHSVLKLLHDIIASSVSAPLSTRTAGLLAQLSGLLADADWRPFVLRWGLLLLAAEEPEGVCNSMQALDHLMRDNMQVFTSEMKLPLALLLLAACGSQQVQQAAAAVLQQVGFSLSSYGRLPNEVPGKPDAEAHRQLGQQLLGSPLGLWQLPFVAGFLKGLGLTEELQAKAAEACAADQGAAGAGAADSTEGGAPAPKRQRTDSISGTQTAAAAAPCGGAGSSRAAELAALAPAGSFPGAAPPAAAASPPPRAVPAAALSASQRAALQKMLSQASISYTTPDGQNIRQGCSATVDEVLGVQQLTISAPNFFAPCDNLLEPQALACLTHLVGLQLGSVANVRLLQQLPAQLRQLALRLPKDRQQPLQLLHLHQLEALDAGYDAVLTVADMGLPAHLTSLRAGDCVAAAPLLRLQQLQVLSLSTCTMTADQLRQLTNLHSLREVNFSIEKPSTAAAAAAGWPGLPIQSLTFTGGSKHKWGKRNSCMVMEHLGKLTQLTRLNLKAGLEWTPATQFVTIIQQLTNMQRLKLDNLKLKGSGGGVAGGEMANVMQAIASMPRLVSLDMWSLSYGPAVSQLAAATALTRLDLLFASQLCDDTVRQLSGLTNLRGLSLCYAHVTDASLPALAALQQLRQLSLSDTQVTDAGVAAHLTRLTQLTSLEVRKTTVSQATVNRIVNRGTRVVEW